MNPPLYDEVHQMALDIVNASVSENTKLKWATYEKLKLLCEANENTKNDHPIQWEALADFTDNDAQAIIIYRKALSCAESLNLNEYAASINLAMAERCQDSGQSDTAFELAKKANELAKSTNNLELRQQISEFLLHANIHT